MTYCFNWFSINEYHTHIILYIRQTYYNNVMQTSSKEIKRDNDNEYWKVKNMKIVFLMLCTNGYILQFKTEMDVYLNDNTKYNEYK